MIAEGPNAIVHDGTIYLIYSGSLVGIDYTTGLVTAPAGQDADLTDPNVWTKLDYPLQKSGVYNGQWQLGTGHGMWSNDEDAISSMYFTMRNTRMDGMAAATPRCAACTGPRRVCRYWTCRRRKSSIRTMLI